VKVIAVTGRSGSGKSTVSAYYGSLGYPVLDADRTAREVTRPGGPCLAQLCDAFGSDILLPDGTLDRGCLAARAFATPEGTRRLTDITHPAIIRELLDGVAAAQSTGVPFVFVDGAVIVGEAFEQYCDAIIVVTAPEREAISRIVLRDGISKQAARMRLAAQTPEDVLRAAADYIIANTGDGRHLRAAAQAVLERLLAKERMEQKKKHNRNIYIVLAVVLCLAGVFFVKDAVRAVEEMAYPRTYAALVQQYAAEYGVDENKVYAIIRTESGFKPEAESKVGARGLMQITDETFLWIKSKIAPGEEITFDDLFDPAVNIRFGTYLLATCLARYDGDFSTAAAAYHSGMGLVDSLLQKAEYSADGKTLTAFPYEQMNLYVHKVNKNYQKYLALYAQDEGV
jgi:hypothetical protein